jgi:hypothetical protein
MFLESEKALSCFPLIEIDIQYFVEGEKEIAVGDILTIKLTITQTFLKEKETLGFVHSNKFPFLKQSSWYMVFTDVEENDFIAIEKLVMKERTFVKTIKERLARPGKMMFNMILRNDSYRGFDRKVTVVINVLAHVDRPPVEYDEEDIQAQKAPSMMQSMMELAPESGSDDDDSEDEAAANAKKQPQHHHHHNHQHQPAEKEQQPEATPEAKEQPSETKKDQ